MDPRHMQKALIAPAVISPFLAEFETQASDDWMKRDLELVHVPCGTRICDVEDGDTLEALARTAIDHLPGCPGGKTAEGASQ